MTQNTQTIQQLYFCTYKRIRLFLVPMLYKAFSIHLYNKVFGVLWVLIHFSNSATGQATADQTLLYPPRQFSDYYIPHNLDSFEHCCARLNGSDSLRLMHAMISLELGRGYSHKFGENIPTIERLSEKFGSGIGKRMSVFLSALFFRDVDLEKSYQYGLRTLELFEKERDTSGLLAIHNFLYFLNRGSFNTVPGDSSFKEKHYQEVLKLGNQLATPGASLSQIKLMILEDTSKTAQYAEGLFQKALQIIREHPIQQYHLVPMHTIMSTYHAHRGNIERAKSINEAAFELVKNTGGFNKVLVMFNLGYNNYALNKYDQSEKIFAGTIEAYQSEKIEKPDMFMNMYRFLSQSQFELGKYAEAWKNRDIQDSLDQIISKKAKEAEFLKLEVKYESKQKDLEISILKEIQERQRRTTNFTITTTILLLLLLAISLFFFRKNKNKNLQLERFQEDILERNKHLQVANAKMEYFTYALSHDALAFINNIINQATLAQMHTASSDSSSYAKRIFDVGKALKRMTTELIVLNRSKHLQVHAELINLKSIGEEVLNDFDSQSFNRVEIKNTLEHHAYANPTLTKQVFRNIISNALKNGKPDGHLTIAITSKENHEQSAIEVIIEDNGIGIAADKISSIFEAFEVGKQENTKKGYGLGLFICSEAVSSMGGKIWAKSLDGVGSSFHFTLPKNALSQEV